MSERRKRRKNPFKMIGNKRLYFHMENMSEKDSENEHDTKKYRLENDTQHKRETRQMKTESTWYCSWTLFPHLMYVYNLTCDFVKRYSNYLGDCKLLECLRNPLEDFSIQIDIKAAGGVPEIQCCENGFEENVWPMVLRCDVKDGTPVQITDEAVQINTKDIKLLQNVIHESRRASFSIKAWFCDPAMKNIHEAMTELLERPILGFIKEAHILFSNLDCTNPLQNNIQSETPLTELDMLLKIVKQTSPVANFSFKSCPFDVHKSDIPEGVKDYLSRKREVVGFGLWWNGEFRVFVKRKENSRHLEINLLKMGANLFQKYPLKILESNLRFDFFLKQGDRISPVPPSCTTLNSRNPTSVSSSQSSQVSVPSSYGTLGGFVKDNSSNIYALTCSHVCNSINSQAFACLSENSPIEKIGKCVFWGNVAEKGDCCDISLVQIEGSVKKHCKLSMENSFTKECNVIVEDLRKIDKVDYVHKLGATTSLTTGRIVAPEFCCNLIDSKSKMFLVAGMSEKFSEPGDSGSIVYVNENNSLLDKIKVIGIVFGGEIERENADPSIDFGKTSLCYELVGDLEIAKKNNFDVSFENQQPSN